jgi:hypothetical protein
LPGGDGCVATSSIRQERRPAPSSHQGYGIWRRRIDGSWWDDIDHAAVCISVGPDGLPWVVQEDNNILQRLPTLPAPTWAPAWESNVTENSITVHWLSVPLQEAYLVFAINANTGNAEAETGANPPATSCTVNGLSPGTPYEFQLNYHAPDGQLSPTATSAPPVWTLAAPPPPPVAVPPLVGLTLTQALNALDNAGLQANVINPSNVIENDLLKVVAQNPGAHTRVPPGSSVDVTVTPISQPVQGYGQVEVENANGTGQPVQVWLINNTTGVQNDVGSVAMNDQRTFPLDNGVVTTVVAVDATRPGCNGDPLNPDCEAAIGSVLGSAGGPTWPFQVR